MLSQSKPHIRFCHVSVWQLLPEENLPLQSHTMYQMSHFPETHKILQTKEKLNRILADNTGQPYEVVCRDTERDHYMTAEEAVSYGLVDQILVKH